MDDLCNCSGQSMEVHIPPCAVPRKKGTKLPDGGEPGQILVKTETGAEWQDVPETHQPMIQDGTWRVWDAEKEAYVDTGVQAQGPEGEAGPQGPQGKQGEPGPAGADGMSQEDGDKRYLQLTGGMMQTTMQRINFLHPEDEALMASAFEVWDEYGENGQGIGLYGGGIVFLNKKNINAGNFIDATQSGVIQFYETYDETGLSRPIRLNGLADPEGDDDAPNKKYVDDTIKAAVGDISAALDAINGEVA